MPGKDTAPMLWIRGLIFTIWAPGVVGFFLPRLVDPLVRIGDGPWQAGWIAVAAGTAGYLLCLFRFLAAGGTPAIFFTRPLKALLGEEPGSLVSGGLYGISRNPMYVSVLLVIFGQALLYASGRIAIYGCVVFAVFHLVVVFHEEPHLREIHGRAYELYCEAVPRWLGQRRRRR